MDQNPQSQLKLLVIKGKEQGYLTYAEVNDHLPAEIVDSEQVEDIIYVARVAPRWPHAVSVNAANAILPPCLTVAFCCIQMYPFAQATRQR